jgi:hypothetical protein
VWLLKDPTFRRNVGSYKSHTAYHPRIWRSLNIKLLSRGSYLCTEAEGLCCLGSDTTRIVRSEAIMADAARSSPNCLLLDVSLHCLLFALSLDCQVEDNTFCRKSEVFYQNTRCKSQKTVHFTLHSRYSHCEV